MVDNSDVWKCVHVNKDIEIYGCVLCMSLEPSHTLFELPYTTHGKH